MLKFNEWPTPFGEFVKELRISPGTRVVEGESSWFGLADRGALLIAKSRCPYECVITVSLSSRAPLSASANESLARLQDELRSATFLRVAGNTILDDEIDLRCETDGGMNPWPWDSRYGLQVLGSCASTYCKERLKTDNTRSNIKFSDSVLARFSKVSKPLSDAVDEYQAACRTLLRNYCQACPRMDQVNSAVLSVKSRRAEADDDVAILRSQDNFASLSRVLGDNESDLACGAQVSTLARSLRAEYDQNVQRFSRTKCGQ